MNFKVNPLSKIIGLSGLLAIGFLLIVLPTALYGNWMPIMDGLIFAIAHIPYLLTNSGLESDYETGFGDIGDIPTNNAADFGKWLSSFMVFSGVALPVSLCRNNILSTFSSTLTIMGGLCIYSTIVIFTTFFDRVNAYDDPFAT